MEQRPLVVTAENHRSLKTHKNASKLPLPFLVSNTSGRHHCSEQYNLPTACATAQPGAQGGGSASPAREEKEKSQLMLYKRSFILHGFPRKERKGTGELKKDNFLLGPALKYLSICWYSERVKVCNIEDWMKNSFQKDFCKRHENTVNDFLLEVCNRCPNLLSLTLSGCGHVTDDCISLLLQSCPKLRTLRLENCVRLTDRALEAAALHGAALRRLHVDFCRNVTGPGLQRVRERCPWVTLRAERSAQMIPDIKPEKKLMLEKPSGKSVRL
ncbi:F-box and leucine-rich protein 22 isoform 1-T1 [Podargus strigoides]